MASLRIGGLAAARRQTERREMPAGPLPCRSPRLGRHERRGARPDLMPACKHTGAMRSTWCCGRGRKCRTRSPRPPRRHRKRTSATAARAATAPTRHTPRPPRRRADTRPRRSMPLRARIPPAAGLQAWGLGGARRTAGATGQSRPRRPPRRPRYGDAHTARFVLLAFWSRTRFLHSDMVNGANPRPESLPVLVQAASSSASSNAVADYWGVAEAALRVALADRPPAGSKTAAPQPVSRFAPPAQSEVRRPLSWDLVQIWEGSDWCDSVLLCRARL